MNDPKLHCSNGVVWYCFPLEFRISMVFIVYCVLIISFGSGVE